MELRLEQLGPTFKRQEEPACASCGYDASWIFRVETLDRMFCDRCMLNAALDIINFHCPTPSAP